MISYMVLVKRPVVSSRLDVLIRGNREIIALVLLCEDDDDDDSDWGV